MKFLRMGVLNCTPNSFSDGGELSPDNFLKKIESMGPLEALDIGAESTAPMNSAISWEEEWERLKPYLPLLKKLSCALSFDTYHPETIENVVRLYHDDQWDKHLIWNDVSGKFDGFAYDFLSLNPKFSYVLCHNLCPNRGLTGRHMEYTDPELTLEKVAEFFRPYRIPQIIFDPCLGFSKTYEQNWMLLDHFQELQVLTGHHHWLLGFSRKSFLRKKFGLEISDRSELDRKHADVLFRLKAVGDIWIRTHRPELIPITG